MDSEICVVETGGSSISHHKSLFSHDAKYLLCPCGNIIKVYSTNTGECFQRLVGHNKLVTGISHHPKVKLQILSCSEDSTVKVWDYEDGNVLATFQFDAPLIGIFSHQKYPSTLLVVKKENTSNELHKFSLPPPGVAKDIISSSLISKIFVESCEKYIALSETYVVVACPESFTVFINPLHLSPKSMIKHKLSTMLRHKPITCISCHPTEKICVTGHEMGKIRVWYNITSGRKITCNERHWHSLDVTALSYTPSGSMLLSGGHENVLVQWREGDTDFKPRLGSSLVGITVSEDGLLYAVSLQENSILLISNTFKIIQCIEGFAAASNDFPCGLKYDPATNACVTTGKPGHLLFYLCPTDSQLYNLDVICQNFISSANLYKPLSRTAITNVAFVKTQNDDYHMATLEFNKTNERYQKLKFWCFDETQRNWLLETVVSSPHNNKEVTSLCFHPKEKLAVTTSLDCSAKIWIKLDKGWTCDRALSYRSYQCNHAVFSQDGSILALVFGESILFAKFDDLDTLDLFISLSVPIKSIHFGRNSCFHLLVITTCDYVQCWDLSTSAMAWYTEVENVNFVVQDQFSENLALFTNDKEVFIFRPSDSSPLFTYDVDDVIVTACFIPETEDGISWLEKSSLFMITKNAVVKKFTLRSIAEESQAHRHRSEIDGSLNTPMSSLLSLRIGKSEVESDAGILRHSTVEDALKYIRDTPVHVLPGMSSLCRQFITSLLFDGSDQHPRASMQKSIAETSDEIETTTEDEENAIEHYEEKTEREEDFSFLLSTFDNLSQ